MRDFYAVAEKLVLLIQGSVGLGDDVGFLAVGGEVDHVFVLGGDVVLYGNVPFGKLAEELLGDGAYQPSRLGGDSAVFR